MICLADLIYLREKELSSKPLNSAIKDVEQAIDALSKLDNQTGYGSFYDAKYEIGGVTHHVFLESAQKAAEIMPLLDDVLSLLQQLKPILEQEPESFVEVDNSFRNRLTKVNGTIICNKKSKSRLEEGYDKAVGFFSGLFSSKGNKTGGKMDLVEENKDTSLTEEPMEKEETTAEVAELKVVAYNEWKSGTKGQIRFVDQSKNETANGWGSRAGDASSECNTACQSMALSYMGVDRSPEELLNTGKSMECGANWESNTVRGTENIHQTGEWAWDQENIDGMLNSFIADNGTGDVSPVLIRYGVNTGNWAPGHWIMLVDRNPDGSYVAVGPWGDGEQGTVYINDGVISCNGNFSHMGNGETWSVHAYTQYSR